MRVLLIAFVSVALLGCSAGNHSKLSTNEADFALSILPETAVHGTSVCDWSTAIEPTEDGCIVSVSATGASGQKALYFDLEYDAETMHPVAAESVESALECEPLSIAILDDRSTVHYGMILPTPDKRTGFSGDGVLASVEFRDGAAMCSRRVSEVPAAANGAVWLEDDYPSTLKWLYQNTGDCNQDGLVTASDLTPIAVYFDQTTDPSTMGINVSGQEWMSDTNTDGYVTVADLTGIGQNYGNSVLGGYRVYSSDSLDEYPTEPNAANGTGSILLDEIELPDIANITQPDFRHRYEYVAASIDPDKFYWVRPVDDDGKEGPASNAIMQIGLAVPRTPGAGAELSINASATRLDWYFCSPGDYNQDGLINNNDMTPLGRHWFDQGPFEPYSRECLVDSNDDDVIDVKDGFVMTLNYSTDQIISGYNIYSSMDENDYPARADEPDRVSPIGFKELHEADHYNDVDCEFRREYHFALDSPISGTYYWVRLVDENGMCGTPSNMVQYIVPE